MSKSVVLTDPRHDPDKSHNAIERWALRFIRDERDLPFLKLMAQMTFIQIPLAILLFVPGVFRWWLGLAYLVMNLFTFFDRFILMLHNTSHRPLFKKQYGFMNKYIPWVLGPFCGQSPETYFAHHMGMHHPENNLEKDLSSTMHYQRDRFDHWLRYFGRFFFASIFELSAYHLQRGHGKMARRLIMGEALFIAACVGLCFVNWQATVFVFIAPYLIARILMMCGNWAQHAFIDGDRPENCYVNSIVCINSRYNRRCFNDGYHIGHHIKAGRHWTEMPVDFERNVDKYVAEDAVVFEKTDYFIIWVWLMLRRYDTLARHFVDLRDDERSHEEIVELLKARTRRIVRDPAVVEAEPVAA